MTLRSLAIAAAAAVAAIGLHIHSAEAFNTYNGTNFPICVWSNDHGGYFEEVGPHETSRGWAIDKSMTLHVSVKDAEACSDHGGCLITCNNDMGSSCTAAPHAQQYISKILFGGKDNSDAQNEAAYLMGIPARFQLDCNH